MKQYVCTFCMYPYVLLGHYSVCLCEPINDQKRTSNIFYI